MGLYDRAEPRRGRSGTPRPALDLDARDLIAHLLESIDRVRDRQDTLARRLKETLETGTHIDRWEAEPVNVGALRVAWNEFIALGGVSAEDWRAFCLGEKITTQPIKAPIKRKGHLRLIAQRATQPRLRIRKPDPPEAA
jgi:hypothetical protein